MASTLSRPAAVAQKRPASRSTPGQSSSACGFNEGFRGKKGWRAEAAPGYMPERRSSASLRSIFFRAAISLRFRLAEGFS